MKNKIKIIFEYTVETNTSEKWWTPFDTPERLAGHFSRSFDDGDWFPGIDLIMKAIYVNDELIDEDDFDFTIKEEEEEEEEDDK